MGRFGHQMRADRKRFQCGHARRSWGLLLCVLACASLVVAGAESTSLGTFKQWTALTFPDDGGISCMMWSQPAEREVSMEGRGGAFLFVTHRTAPEEFDAVTLDNGYTFGAGTRVNVSIGKHDFVLATSGSNAWTLDPADNGEMVKAMRAGYRMRVQGTSVGGTRTSDVYSLLGFTAAHEAIDKACGRG